MRLKTESQLAMLRENSGLTQVQLAALVGVTPNTIQNWEKQLQRYLKLAEVFGCEVADLVKYVESTEEHGTQPKGFSIEELRELRERWGTGVKAETQDLTADHEIGEEVRSK